ncbi:NAD(P)/FAD-dependent oxidoreductase [Persicitalea sp.]|uniref:NAD(P)/FAD-dependent oxidoreductase n=1 Tax=Persicitalea sp. TaxID=3100273 RepID=UPI0035932B6A
MNNTDFDVIIVGGSSAGLSAGLALGRALRRVLILDSGQPCNGQTPHSHNFFTQDGSTPQQILATAKAQLARYPTLTLRHELATYAQKTDTGFVVTTKSGQVYQAQKLIAATGIKDLLPTIDGFAACWGISVIHCPYCHGYEFRQQPTGILANGDTGFEAAKLISNWTPTLTLFTNGPSTLSPEQTQSLQKHQIAIDERTVAHLDQRKGYLDRVIFTNRSSVDLKALYARLPFVQHSDIPAQLGCDLTEQGYIATDVWQKTSVAGLFACGDNSTFMRSVANAVYSGSMAGGSVNMELINQTF